MGLWAWFSNAGVKPTPVEHHLHIHVTPDPPAEPEVIEIPPGLDVDIKRSDGPETIKRKIAEALDKRAQAERLTQAQAKLQQACDARREAEADWERRLEHNSTQLETPVDLFRVVPHSTGHYRVQRWQIDEPGLPGRWNGIDFLLDGHLFPGKPLINYYEDRTYSINYLISTIRDSPANPKVVWVDFGQGNPFSTYAEAEAWVQAWIANQAEVRFSRSGERSVQLLAPEKAQELVQESA